MIKMTTVYPVLLAGGTGTRLWPLSRKSYPKQFSNLIGKKSLFQYSALRTMTSSVVKFEAHVTLTNRDFRFIVGEQLQSVGIEPKHIIIEPETKNTAPAILAASLFTKAMDPEAVLLVAPSDHIISDKLEFHNAIKIGLQHVNTGRIVTYGITPTYPETGYGYLKLSNDHLDSYGTSKVMQFIEKPAIMTAKKMLESKKYLWNAGIFLFRASDMISAFELYMPEVATLTQQAVETAKPDLGFLSLNAEPWKKMHSVSIDYAIMEKAKNLVAIPYSSKWSDLGGWDAIWTENEKNSLGTATSERAHSIDCSNTLLRSENSSQHIVGLGLDNIIAIAMPDAVLVANKDNAQNVKKVVNHLINQNVPQAETFPKSHRPWGWFESLALGDRFQVKRIYVKQGAALSLQSHRHRSEHWVVVEGTAKVKIGKEVKLIAEGQSVYVPLGVIHRLENPGKVPMVLIEVQTGSYLGEDDIIRYEDLYARN